MRSSLSMALAMRSWTVFPGLRGLGLLAGIALAVYLLAAPSVPAAPIRSSGAQDSTLLRRENCTLCHKPEPGFSHPTGMFPTLTVPEYLPLVQGKVGCTTCHDPGTTPSFSGSGIGHHATLRGPQLLGEFCRECHQNVSAGSMHRTSGRAHLRWADRQSRPVELENQMDVESRSCLICHDGSIAKDVTARGDVRNTHDKGHPIGTRYLDRPAGRTSVFALTPAQSLDSRIRLFQNTIGCGSCHSPYSHEDKMLVMSNDRSRLCMSCHRM